MNTENKQGGGPVPPSFFKGTILQTKLGSLIESVINTAIGFVLSIAISVVVFPMFGHEFTLVQNFWITVIFTVASIARSYCVRRWANGRIHAAAERMAAVAS